MAKPFAGKVVFITGASSGIGAALARELGAQGAKVALSARRVERLESLAQEIVAAGGSAMAVACDVTEDGSVERAVAEVEARFGRLDVAIANAGFGVNGKVERLGLDDFRRQFETNVFGVLRTVYATLPALEATRGALVLVGSVNSYLTLPTTAAYSMSKYAVRALAEALDAELAAKGVAVLLVNPGFVESEIRTVNNKGELARAAKDPVPPWLQMPSGLAAKKIARAIARRRHERVLTAHGQLGVLLARHVPSLVRLVSRRLIAPRLGAKKTLKQG